MTNFSSAMTTRAGAEGSPLTLEQERGAWLRRVHAFSLFALAAFVSFSIAGAHISLGLLTLCVIAQSARRRGRRAEGEGPRAEGKEQVVGISPGSSILLDIEWPIAAFVLIALASTTFSETPLPSLHNLRHLLTILGAYAVALSLRWHPEWHRPVLWIFIATATAAALYGLGKYAFGFTSKVQSTQGTTMTWGALSVMFMAVTMQMALAAPIRRERWLARGAIIPQVFAMLLSLVRGAYVGFAASVVYIFRRYWANRQLLVRRILPAF
jgi:hypothetical protein